MQFIKKEKIMKKYLIIIVALMALLLSGCSKKELIEEGYLVVATSPDYAPYEFIDPSKSGMDKYVGADIDLMKYIANKLELKIKIEELDFEACLVAIQGRKVDIAISGFSWSPVRDNNYQLSKSYFSEGDGLQQILILAENAGKYSSLADLNKAGVKVAAQSGSIQDELVDDQLPNATKQNLDNLDMAIELLGEGKVDAVAISEHAADIRIQNSGKYKFAVVSENFDVPTIGNVVVAKKGNVELIEKINNIIDEVIESGLYEQWMEAAKAYASNIGEVTE